MKKYTSNRKPQIVLYMSFNLNLESIFCLWFIALYLFLLYYFAIVNGFASVRYQFEKLL